MGWSYVDFWSPNAKIFGGKVLKLTVLHTNYYSHKIIPWKIIAIRSILAANNIINVP